MSVFANSRIVRIARYGAEGLGPEGTVSHAVFSLAGQEYMAMDSPVEHEFTFTPAMSIFVSCETEEEIDRLYAALSEDGEAMMPLGDYGFSRKFGWLTDKFGVSWQFNLGQRTPLS